MNIKRIALTVALSLIVVASVAASLLFNKDGGVILDPHAASIVLVAPDQVAPSQLVVLDVSGSIASSYKWEVVPASSNFMVIDDGKRAVFSAAGGEYLFIIAAAKGDSVDVKTHKIKVEGSVPSTSLKGKVIEWAKQVNSPTKRDDLIRLSQSFASVASTVEVGGLNPENILQATKQSNQQALGSNVYFWQPLFEHLQAELKAQAEAGNLNDAESHVKAWRAIADGLADYAKTLPVQKKRTSNATAALAVITLRR